MSMTCNITTNKVKKEEPVIPKNQWNIKIYFDDVRESERLYQYYVESKEELEDALNVISVLKEIKSRLSKDWNKWCNLGPYEFDNLISEIGLSDFVSGDDLYNLPTHEDFDEILGRLDYFEITYFDKSGIEYECDISND